MPWTRFEPARDAEPKSNTISTKLSLYPFKISVSFRSNYAGKSNFEIAPKLHNIHKGTSGLLFLNVFTFHSGYNLPPVLKMAQPW